MRNTVWSYNGVEFNDGDRVMVVGWAEDFETNAMGVGKEWENTWVYEMREAIFREFDIDFIDETGVHFVEVPGLDCSCYGYPLSVLRNLTAEMRTAA